MANDAALRLRLGVLVREPLNNLITINSELSAFPRYTSYLYAGVVVEPSLLGPILEIHLRIRAVVRAVVRLLAHAPEAAWVGLGFAWFALTVTLALTLTLTLTLTTAAWSEVGRPNPNQGRPNPNPNPDQAACARAADVVACELSGPLAHAVVLLAPPG